MGGFYIGRERERKIEATDLGNGATKLTK